MPKLFPVLIFLALLFAPGVALAQSATLTLSPDRAQVNVNDVVSVLLILNSAEPVTSLKTSLLYDPTLLFVAAVNTTNSVFSYWWENTHAREGGAGRVNFQDVSALLSRWDSTTQADLDLADIDCPDGVPDGRIDLYDANKLMANWTL